METVGEFRSKPTCSARPVVAQRVDGASKPKPLLDGRSEFPDGIWARLFVQQAIANVAVSDRAASRYLYTAESASPSASAGGHVLRPYPFHPTFRLFHLRPT